MKELHPNHICKNVHCKAQYYACDYCNKTQNWRSMTCSLACYGQYMEQVAMARKQHRTVNLYPERTDMTHDEVLWLVDKEPVHAVLARTIAQLSDYKEDLATLGLHQTIDKINKAQANTTTK